MKILMLGGTGVISTDITERAIRLGHDVTLVTRGNRKAPEGARQIFCDAYDLQSLKSAVMGNEYDVVADFICYTPLQLTARLDALRGIYNQYIFISSVGVYDRGYGQIGSRLSAVPPYSGNIMISECSTPTANFGWDYAYNKISCEHILLKEHILHGTHFTIVRPGETYNRCRVPGTFVCNQKWYTQIDRFRRGLPVIVHDDGMAHCPFTHAEDFAVAFIGLLGNEDAFEEAFHITTDELITWNQVAELTARAAGARAEIVHIPSDRLVKLIPYTCLGETYGVVYCSKRFDNVGYDNRKIKSLVPEFECKISFAEGISRTVKYYDSHPEECIIDAAWNATIDNVIERFREDKFSSK